MKSLFVLLLFIAQAAWALPIVCESPEKTNDRPTLRVKINSKVGVQMNNNVWSLHVIGVTAQDPFESLHRLYGSGSPRPESIHMTLVKSGAVYGYIDASSPASNGLYEGKIRIGGILKNRIMPVECTDEAIHGVVPK